MLAIQSVQFHLKWTAQKYKRNHRSFKDIGMEVKGFVGCTCTLVGSELRNIVLLFFFLPRTAKHIALFRLKRYFSPHELGIAGEVYRIIITFLKTRTSSQGKLHFSFFLKTLIHLYCLLLVVLHRGRCTQEGKKICKIFQNGKLFSLWEEIDCINISTMQRNALCCLTKFPPTSTCSAFQTT